MQLNCFVERFLVPVLIHLRNWRSARWMAVHKYVYDIYIYIYRNLVNVTFYDISMMIVLMFIWEHYCHFYSFYNVCCWCQILYINFFSYFKQCSIYLVTEERFPNLNIPAVFYL